MARLTVTARADGGVEGWGFSIPVSAIASGDNIPITADPDDGQVAQLMPAQFDRFQRLRWLVELDDVALQFAQGINWSSSLERPIQVANCRVAADPARRLGMVLPTGAPVGGMADVDVGLVFRQDNGAEFTEPLITGGLIVESPHDYRPSGIAEELAIHDATARVVHKVVSRSYAAGSNTPRETVVNQLAGDMGIAAADRNVPNMAGVLRKAVDIDRGDGLDLAQAIAEVDGWRLLRDRGGDFTARRWAPEDEARTPSWVFTPADWILSAAGQELGYQLRAAPDAYTSVAMRGSRQVMRATSTCSDETAKSKFSSTSLFQVVALPFTQLAGSGPGAPSYTPNGYIPGAPEERKTTETETWVTMRCGALKAQRTETYALRNIQKARLTRDNDAAGTPLSYKSAEVSAQSLDRPGYMYTFDTWMRDSETFEARFYDGAGFLWKRVSEKWGWYNPRRSVKERASVTNDWETATSDVAYRDLGNGTGVQFDSEHYLLLERETELFRQTHGQLTQRDLKREGYGRTPGNLFLYGDGEFGEREESFRVVFSETEVWNRFQEGRYFKYLNQFGIDGQRDPALPNTMELVNGGPPNVDKMDNSGAADRFEQQEIRAEADADALLAVRPEHEFGPAVFEYAETEDELQSLAERLLLLSNGALLTFWILPNPRCEVGQWVRFIGPPGSGLYHSAKVIETGIQGGDNTPIIQQVLAEIYPEIN